MLLKQFALRASAQAKLLRKCVPTDHWKTRYCQEWLPESTPEAPNRVNVQLGPKHEVQLKIQNITKVTIVVSCSYVETL
jgi:hypothetical protein